VSVLCVAHQTPTTTDRHTLELADRHVLEPWFR
jgi:hypothetical protein